MLKYLALPNFSSSLISPNNKILGERMSRFSVLSFFLTLVGLVLILMAYTSSMARAADFGQARPHPTISWLED